ncbi:hypothetical protein [Jiella mangrovi]|nr:hypothetical protein [Jiella mangrovi]
MSYGVAAIALALEDPPGDVEPRDAGVVFGAGILIDEIANQDVVRGRAD